MSEPTLQGMTNSRIPHATPTAATPGRRRGNPDTPDEVCGVLGAVIGATPFGAKTPKPRMRICGCLRRTSMNQPARIQAGSTPKALIRGFGVSAHTALPELSHRHHGNTDSGFRGFRAGCSPRYRRISHNTFTITHRPLNLATCR